MNLVTASHISKRFGSIQAVDDLSLTLGKGEILGLLGANGAGKTTLIRILCGLLKPDTGSFSVEGRPGYMCQSFSLIEELTVPENIHFYGALYGLSKQEVAAREEEIVRSLQLGPYCDRQVKFLSSGWRQALSFSIAILPNPAVLILDEPTSGLDVFARRRLWKMIHERAEGGMGIIVSTHYLDEAFYCSRLAILSAGKMVANGAPREIAASEADLLPYFEKG